jgi:hypothetical protein
MAEDRRRAPWAWFGLGLSLALGAGAVVLVPLNGGVEHGATAAWNGLTETLNWVLLMLFAGALGVLIALRRPGNALARAFVWAGILGTLTVFGDQYAGYALVARPGSVPGGVAARIVSLISFAAVWFVAGVLVPAWFPNGRHVTRRWKLATWIGGIGAAGWATIVTLPNAFADAGLLGDVPGVTNPLSLPALAPVVNTLSGFGILALFGGMFLAIISMVVRAIRSHGTERQQVKVVAYTVAITTVIQLLVANLQEQLRLPYAVFSVISFLALVAIPVSIATAVIRYRLYDVDRLINRTIVYTIVTGAMVGAYSGVVVLMGSITQRFAGSSDIAVAGGTLVAAALFSPIRGFVQRFVDRRFYRTRYDSAQTLEAFVAHLRSQTDLGSLCEEIESVAWRTLKPSLVTLWIPPERARDRVLR